MVAIISKAAPNEQDRLHHFHPMTNPVTFFREGPEIIERAEGVYIYTSDGRKIIDAGSGLANVNIGYGNERLCNVAFETMKQLSFGHSYAGRSNPWTAALSEKLVSITPEQFQSIFFASTGSDAVESAVKMAWRYWRLRGKSQKHILLSRKHSYHGNTIVAASLTGSDKALHAQFGLPLRDMIHLMDSPFWYRYGREKTPEEFGLIVAQSLENRINEIGAENIAAFIGDPIQTGGGTIIPPSTYWPEVRRICDKYDILLIADEVISGFGKTGKLFGFENFGFEPDMFVMAKGLSSGYFPISAVAIGEKVAQILKSADETFAHIFTNCGHPVGAAIALENIDIINEEKLVERVSDDVGPYFSQRLQELLTFPCIGEVRPLGVLGGIEVDVTTINGLSQSDNDLVTEKLVSAAWNRGMAVRGAGLALPMIISRTQIDEIIDILKCSLHDVVSEL